MVKKEQREVIVERDNRGPGTGAITAIVVVVLIVLFFVFGGWNLFGGGTTTNTTIIQTPAGSGTSTQ